MIWTVYWVERLLSAGQVQWLLLLPQPALPVPELGVALAITVPLCHMPAAVLPHAGFHRAGRLRGGSSLWD